MSFEIDPKKSITINAANFVIMCDQMTELRKQRDELLESLKKCFDALESCTPSDYSTGHIIYPSFDESLVADAYCKAERSIASVKGLKCETCNGRGEVGGHVGQTPESFDYVTEPCPDCSVVKCGAA